MSMDLPHSLRCINMKDPSAKLRPTNATFRWTSDWFVEGAIAPVAAAIGRKSDIARIVPALSPSPPSLLPMLLFHRHRQSIPVSGQNPKSP